MQTEFSGNGNLEAGNFPAGVRNPASGEQPTLVLPNFNVPDCANRRNVCHRVKPLCCFGYFSSLLAQDIIVFYLKNHFSKRNYFWTNCDWCSVTKHGDNCNTWVMSLGSKLNILRGFWSLFDLEIFLREPSDLSLILANPRQNIFFIL